MTRPTRNRPASLFAATAADLPLFSGTCQRAEAQQYTPREVAQQDSWLDRREYIARNPAEYHRRQVARMVAKMPDEIRGVFELAPETNAEARQQDSDTEDDYRQPMTPENEDRLKASKYDNRAYVARNSDKRRVYTPLLLGLTCDPRIPESPCSKCGKSNHAPNFFNATVTASGEACHICNNDPRWLQIRKNY